MSKWWCVVLLAAVSLTGAELSVERSEVTSPVKIGKRHRVVAKPLIFGRIQPYNLYGNYLDEWIDRPLYHNSAWRSGGAAISFKRDAEAALEYGIDGFTMLGNAYQNRYPEALRLLKEAGGVPGFTFMAGISWGSVGNKERSLMNVRTAYESPITLRINGKVPFFPYLGTKPETIAQFREFLEKKGYKKNIFFNSVWLDVFAAYNNNKGKLPDAVRDKAKKMFEERLANADGMILVNYHMFRDPKKEYLLARKFYFKLDEEYMAPMLEEIYAKPENAEKLLGFDIRHCYVNHGSGVVEAEQGTSQLREAMDTALLFNPDIISLVEWNEANENTSFQPSVANSRSLQRIIRFYARKLKGQPTAPDPGDDLAKPNLIVSVRRTIRLGEYYRIELLNVPDSDEQSVYTVALTLKDEKGRVLKRFKADRFRRDQLTAVTYKIPSEELVDCRCVIPELEIHWEHRDFKVADGLRATLLETSLGWDHKEIRIPLRDMLECQASLSVRDGKIEAKAASDAGISTLEVLNSDELWLAEGKKRLEDPELYDAVIVHFAGRWNEKTRKTSLEVTGTDKVLFQPWGRPYAGFGDFKALKDEPTRFAGNLLFWHNGPTFVLQIPKNAADAVLKFDVEGKKFEVPVKTILQCVNYGMELGTFGTVRFSLRRRPFDHPAPATGNALSCSGAEDSAWSRDAAYQLRAIGGNSLIYRSQFVFPVKDSAQKEKLNIFSAGKGKAVTVEVPVNRIVELDFAFTPQYGTVLAAPGYRRFDGSLGGGFFYSEVMHRAPQLKGNDLTAPTWKEAEKGQWLLDFDGKFNYLNLPVDAFPAASFTVSFECKVADGENRMLFRHGNFRPSSIQSWIEEGKLRLAFSHMGVSYGDLLKEFETGLAVNPGEWSKITLSYDLRYLRAEVNGRVWITPFNKRATYFASACFGGFSKDDKFMKGRRIGFFKGELRSLKIRHNALPLTAKDFAIMEACRKAEAAKIRVNGKFLGGSAKLPAQWYFNPGHKPQGTSEVISSGKYNRLKISATPEAPAQVYSAPFAVKGGEKIVVSAGVSGEGASLSLMFYDADSRYIASSPAVSKVTNGKIIVEIKVPETVKKKAPAFARIGLNAEKGAAVIFDRVTAHRKD